MASLAIGRLANRVLGADAEAAWATLPVLERATRRLSAELETLLPAILRAAGLPDDAVVALRRIELRLPMAEDPDGLARAWAAEIAASVAAALQTADLLSAGRTPAHRIEAATTSDGQRGSVVFADPWRAQVEILRLLAARLPLPWWAESLIPGASVADQATNRNVFAILTTWIERDPARFAVALLDLLAQAPSIASLLSPAQLRRLAERHLHRLGATIDASLPARSVRPVPMRGETENIQAAVEAALSALPKSVLAALAALPPDGRGLFNLAALLSHTPAVSVCLCDRQSLAGGPAAVLDALSAARLPITVVPSTPTMDLPGPAAVLDAVSAARLPITAAPSAPAMKPADLPGPATFPRALAAAASVPVMSAGLLLLLRPLAALGVVEGGPPASLGREFPAGRAIPALLQAIGLAALRRVVERLPLAPRRTLLERDRPLLAVFSGSSPPDAPLDTLPVGAEAQVYLDALLATAPVEIAWAPGALRQYSGGSDPFGDTAEGRLARILLRPARLTMTRWSADLTWPVASADVALRRAGWDIDPGWLPWIGRVVRFHYDEADAT